MLSLFGALFSFLKCLILWLAGAIVAGITLLVNAVIAALAAVVGFVLGLLPDLDLQSLSPPDWLAQAAWVVPLNQVILASAVVFGVLVIWPLIGTLLRWARVVE